MAPRPSLPVPPEPDRIEGQQPLTEGGKVADETTINDNPENGPKTTEALAALDAAIAKVEAFQADDDEQDSSDIWVRVRELEKRLQGAPSHSPKDALTGLPIA